MSDLATKGFKTFDNGIVARHYEKQDYDRILDFLKKNYEKNGIGYSWNIDRFNFTYTVSRIMNDVSVEAWEQSYLIFEENGEIIAVVSTEGERNGESFIQVDREKYDEEIIKTAFDFIEANHRITRDGKTYISIRLKHDLEQLSREAILRGFTIGEYYEPDAMLSLEGKEDLHYELPEGFKIIDGQTITGKDKGFTHSRAFGYYKRDESLVETAGKAFEEMVKTPGYRQDTDIAVVNEKGEMTAFATLWYDDYNQIAILEPVGTHEDYRRMGLGKAAIYEGINRVKRLGCKKIYVGSDQAFYQAIGFKVVDRHDVYTKVYQD